VSETRMEDDEMSTNDIGASASGPGSCPPGEAPSGLPGSAAAIPRALWQPENTDELAAAIRDIEAKLPGWWWTTGACSVSRHASCGPDRQGPAAHLCETLVFGNGFDVDLAEGSCADALRDVMEQGLAALAAFEDGETPETEGGR
jgi:hypothetical protein